MFAPAGELSNYGIIIDNSFLYDKVCCFEKEIKLLHQTDRLALAVPDADKAAAGLNKIFDSIVVGDIKDNEANARRVTLQWGCDQLELFEPKGSGPVADFISSGKRGIFAGGFALQDPAAVAEKIEKAGIKVCQQGCLLYTSPSPRD